MIYLEENLNLLPASQETLDNFCDLAQACLVPAQERMDFRLVGAWDSHREYFCQVTQLLEFDSLEAFAAFRTRSSEDAEWQQYQAELGKLCPEQHNRLHQLHGAVEPDVWRKVAEQSQREPLGVYSKAVLGTAPGKMAEAVEQIKEAAQYAPITVCLRSIAGGRVGEVTDFWNGDIRRDGWLNPHQDPLNTMTREEFYALMKRVRPVFPTECVSPIFPLAYSPLQ